MIAILLNSLRRNRAGVLLWAGRRYELGRIEPG
jgi:hypothetical protein